MLASSLPQAFDGQRGELRSKVVTLSHLRTRMRIAQVPAY